MLTTLQSATTTVTFGDDLPTVIIGERINPTGRKAFSAELQAGDLSRIARDAKAQVESGAGILDVNVGAAGVDEVALLPRAVEIVQDAADVPVCLDSANPAALAAALRVVKGRALINSVNGEEARLSSVLPLAAEHDAALICLCMDDSGIPETPEARFAVAETIAERAARLNIPLERLVFDPLVMTVGNDHRAIVITADTARLIRSQLGCNMTVGASNASHGMPERELLNTVLLAVLISVGINAPICNPMKNALAVRAADLILGRDEWAMNYIQTYRKLSAQKET